MKVTLDLNEEEYKLIQGGLRFVVETLTRIAANCEDVGLDFLVAIEAEEAKRAIELSNQIGKEYENAKTHEEVEKIRVREGF